MKKKIIIIISSIFIISLTLVASYAYLNNGLVGNPESAVNVSMKNVSINFSDNNPDIDAQNIKPGWTYQKSFSVTNNGEEEVTYDLLWLNIENEFINDEMVYSVICTSNCNGVNETGIVDARGENIKILTNTINPNETQTYTLTIEFKEINANQNYNAGKTFIGKLGIKGSGTYEEKYVAELLASDWTYTLNNNTKTVTLSKYTDSDPNVKIYPCYEVNGVEYNTVVARSTFNGNTTIESVKFLGNINFANNDMQYLFRNCTNLKEVDLSKLDTSNITNMGYLFDSCSSLTSLSLSSFNTSNVTNMREMFSGCSSLTTLDLTSFNTSNVTSIRGMFASCSSLTTLNLSNFNTSNVTDMNYMFRWCSSLTALDLSNFNTSSLTTMQNMFEGCSSLSTLNLTSFNTSSVTTMFNMFQNCSSLTTLNLSNFNTSSVTNMNGMFNGCSSLSTLNLSNFNTEKVTIMSNMFANCSSLTSLNLTSFNTEKVTSMANMFRNANKLTEIKVKNTFVIATNNTNMFAGCGTNQLTYIE